MANKNEKNPRQETRTNSSSSFFGAKFWAMGLVLILGPAMLLARFSLIRLNFDKPLKANYIE